MFDDEDTELTPVAQADLSFDDTDLIVINRRAPTEPSWPPPPPRPAGPLAPARRHAGIFKAVKPRS
ncbi:MAG: hypothetical protein H0X17_23240 [Deltaproteobacteria bacterium]|nr:hypothetical protein [Deltaproteobacteria bacterium]